MTSSPAIGSAEARPAPPLKAAVVSGSLWTLVGYAVTQALRLGNNLILTRLLTEEAFGLMALITALIQGLEMFSDVGIGPSIVRSERGNDPRFLNTVWTIQVGRGLVHWLIAVALAYPFATFYGQPELASLVPIAASMAVLSGFYSTGLFTLIRDMGARKLALIEITSQLAATAFMIAWALRAPSVWALVAGSLFGCGVKLVLSHVVRSGVRNRFAWEPAAAKSLFHFGRWIFVSTTITFMVMQADRLIFGKMIPLAMLGVYSIGLMIATLPMQALSQIGSRIAFPLYMRLVSGGAELASVFHRVRQPILVAGGFATSCLIALGPFVIAFLYDRRYAEAGWVVSVLAFGGWFSLLEATNGAALLARGKTNVFAMANGAKLASMLVLIPAGYHVAGFPGAVAGFALADMARYAVSAIAVSAHGLRCWAADLRLFAMITAASAGAWLAARACQDVLFPIGPLLAGGAVAAVVWWVPVFQVLRELKPR